MKHLPKILSLDELQNEDAFETLVALRESLGQKRQGLSNLAKSLPSLVSDFSPELALELSRLARSLYLFAPRLPTDIQRLSPRVRAHWRRTQLWCRDTSWLQGASDEELGQVLAKEKLASPDAMPVLRRLVEAKWLPLRSLVLRDLASCVANLSLSPSDAALLLVDLSEDEDEGTRAKSIKLLSASWLFGLTPKAERRRASAIERCLDDERPRVVLSALDSAVALANVEAVQRVFGDAARTPAVRAAALGHLGSAGEEEHIAPLLRLAAEEPLTFGAPAHDALLRMHRRGVFVREPHLDALLHLFDVHQAFSGSELVRVTHLIRRQLIERLQSIDADDERWERRAEILAASFGSGAHTLLETLLSQCKNLTAAGALIDAAGASGEYQGWQTVFRFYEEMSERVLFASKATPDAFHSSWSSRVRRAAFTGVH